MINFNVIKILVERLCNKNLLFSFSFLSLSFFFFFFPFPLFFSPFPLFFLPFLSFFLLPSSSPSSSFLPPP